MQEAGMNQDPGERGDIGISTCVSGAGIEQHCTPGSRTSGYRLGGNLHVDGERDDDLQEDEPAPCNVLSYAGYSQKGYTPHNSFKRNQDALIMSEDLSTASLFLAVMDGHGEVGDKVAQAFKRGLAPAVFDHPEWAVVPENAVVESISRIEQSLIVDPSVNTDFSGTTLASVCIRGTQLIMTNVGDSRITLGRQRGTGKIEGAGGFQSTLVAQPLTEDHKPDTPGEKQRILLAGGRVSSAEYADGVGGPPRMWLGNENMPGLAMSRSLGDAVAHTAGVTSDPDTYRCELLSESECVAGEYGNLSYETTGEPVVVILATDGLWEFVSDQEAVDIVSQSIGPRDAVERLIQEASKRWMKEEQVIDDTTVCVAFLKSWKSWKRNLAGV